MALVTIMNAEEYVSKSQLNYFQILMISDGELFNWTDSGFQKIGKADEFSKNRKLFQREQAVLAYNSAVSAAKKLMGGHIEIVEISFK